MPLGQFKLVFGLIFVLSLMLDLGDTAAKNSDFIEEEKVMSRLSDVILMDHFAGNRACADPCGNDLADCNSDCDCCTGRSCLEEVAKPLIPGPPGGARANGLLGKCATIPLLAEEILN